MTTGNTARLDLSYLTQPHHKVNVVKSCMACLSGLRWEVESYRVSLSQIDFSSLGMGVYRSTCVTILTPNILTRTYFVKPYSWISNRAWPTSSGP